MIQEVKNVFRSEGRSYYWGSKFALSVLDQGLYAGSNFLLNILLARWLTPFEYGIFAIGYAGFLLVVAFHNAIVIEPMTIFGAGKYDKYYGNYLGIIFTGHIRLLIIFVPVIIGSLLASHFYIKNTNSLFIGSVTIAVPMILLVYTVRRAFYIKLHVSGAALCSTFYLILLLALVYILRRTNALSHSSAFLIMGLCSLIVSIFFIRYLHPQFLKGNDFTFQKVLRDHWIYGRWALVTSMLIWMSGNLYYMILPVWVNLEDIAGFRALLNLPLPAIHINAALTALFMPILSRHFKTIGINKMKNTLKLFLSLLLGTSFLILLILSSYPKGILNLLYSGTYTELYYMMPMVGLLPVVGSFITVFGCALRVMEQPNKVFWSYLVSTCIGLSIGIILIQWIGINGALWGMILSYITTGVMMFIHLYKLIRLSDKFETT